MAKQSKSNTFNESEMALFYEPTHQYAQKVLDGADIVRDAIFQQLPTPRQSRDCSILLNTPLVDVGYRLRKTTFQPLGALFRLKVFALGLNHPR